MAQAKVEASTFSLRTAIRACEKGKEWQLAWWRYHKMAQANVEASTFSLLTAISACGNGTEWQHAW